MCLYVESKERPTLQQATEDIKVYKVLLKVNNFWVTPFQSYLVREATMCPHGTYRPVYIESEGLWEIGEGVIHTYAYRANAIQLADDLNFCSRNAVVFEAVIPAKTLYVMGVTEDNRVCYGSMKIELKNYYGEEE